MRLFYLVLLSLAAPALAHDYNAGALTIGHPVAFETPVTAKAGAGFLTITNTGDEDDRLLGVRAAFGMAHIHESTVDDQGVARMEMRESLPIPAGETVTLAPGGLHIMFMGLSPETALKAGTRIPAVLVFEKAGEVEVEFAVEKRGHGGTVTGHEGH